jgi:hypothetical protein
LFRGEFLFLIDDNEEIGDTISILVLTGLPASVRFLDDSSRDTGNIPGRLRQTMARATRPFFMGNGVVTETVTFISLIAEKFHGSSCSS